jgi:hypothetical protein
MPHLAPMTMSPRTAKLSAQEKEIQSQRDPKGGARGMEFLKDGMRQGKDKPTKNCYICKLGLGMVRIW